MGLGRLGWEGPSSTADSSVLPALELHSAWPGFCPMNSGLWGTTFSVGLECFPSSGFRSSDLLQNCCWKDPLGSCSTVSVDREGKCLMEMNTVLTLNKRLSSFFFVLRQLMGGRRPKRMRVGQFPSHLTQSPVCPSLAVWPGVRTVPPSPVVTEPEVLSRGPPTCG